MNVLLFFKVKRKPEMPQLTLRIMPNVMPQRLIGSIKYLTKVGAWHIQKTTLCMKYYNNATLSIHVI